jgi:heme-degrading monooxygenase HmoA
MPGTPWKTFRAPEPGREYLALLSELPLRSFLSFPEFLSRSFKIEAQLKDTPGLIGYSLLAQPFQKHFWTLSVWEDDAALRKFVERSPHGETMTAMQGKMGQTSFHRWTLRGEEYPPEWEAALVRATGKLHDSN